MKIVLTKKKNFYKIDFLSNDFFIFACSQIKISGNLTFNSKMIYDTK